MTLHEYLQAERHGFAVDPDFPRIGSDPGTYLVKTPYGPRRVSGDERDAQRHAVAEWKRASLAVSRLAELKQDANTSNTGRAALREYLENEAAALRERIGDNGFVITVADGSLWLGDRRMSAPAIETEAEAVAQVREHESLKRAAFDRAAESAGYSVHLAKDDDLARENRHRDWESQFVDVFVLLGHPQIPTTGRVEIVDGWHCLETPSRLDLAERWGVVWPETLNERVACREALKEAQQRAQRRADDLAEQARRAADDARGGVSA